MGSVTTPAKPDCFSANGMVQYHLEWRRTPKQRRRDAHARGRCSFSAFLIDFHVGLVFDVVDLQKRGGGWIREKSAL
jgi:hypothetical protein